MHAVQALVVVEDVAMVLAEVEDVSMAWDHGLWLEAVASIFDGADVEVCLSGWSRGRMRRTRNGKLRDRLRRCGSIETGSVGRYWVGFVV